MLLIVVHICIIFIWIWKIVSILKLEYFFNPIAIGWKLGGGDLDDYSIPFFRVDTHEIPIKPIGTIKRKKYCKIQHESIGLEYQGENSLRSILIVPFIRHWNDRLVGIKQKNRHASAIALSTVSSIRGLILLLISWKIYGIRSDSNGGDARELMPNWTHTTWAILGSLPVNEYDCWILRIRCSFALQWL